MTLEYKAALGYRLGCHPIECSGYERGDIIQISPEIFFHIHRLVYFPVALPPVTLEEGGGVIHCRAREKEASISPQRAGPALGVCGARCR